MSTITTGNSNDTITGTSGNDIITSGNGNDTINAGDGNDIVNTGNGTDIIDGGSGNDTINSGNGDDVVSGGSGNDIINAGNGDDTVDGGTGNDIVSAGNGDDVLTYVVKLNQTDIDVYDGGNGSDSLKIIFETGVLNNLAAARGYATTTDYLSALNNYFNAHRTDKQMTFSQFGFELTIKNIEKLNLNFTENNIPQALDNSIMLIEDHQYTFQQSDFHFQDSDGNSLHGIRFSELPAAGTGTLLLNGIQVAINQSISVADINAGNLVFVPQQDLNTENSAPLQFKFDVSDGLNWSSSSAILSASISAVNDAPIVNNIILNTNEDAFLPQSVELQAIDPDGLDETASLQYIPQSLTVTSNNSNYVNLNLSEDGTLTYSVNNIPELQSMRAGETKDVTFTYQVTDTNGAITEATGIIHIAGAVDAAIAPALVFETFANTGSVSGQVQAIAVDHDDKLSYSGHLLSQDGKGNFTYNFDPESYRYLAEGESTQVGGYSYIVTNLSNGTTSIGQWFVKILGVNDAPLISNFGTINTNEDDSVVHSIQIPLANDPDRGESLTYSLVSISTPDYVSASINSNTGELTYQILDAAQTLQVNNIVPVTITYKVTDGHGLSNSANAVINIAGLNDAPIAQDTNFSGTEDTTLIIPLSNLLQNASDLDGDTLSILNVSGAQNGSVELVAGEVRFTPHSNYNGIAGFDYTITDGNGGTVTKHANLAISAVNDAPIVDNIILNTNEDAFLPQSVELQAIDPDGLDETASLQFIPQSLTVTSNNSNYVNLSLSEDGTLTYSVNNIPELQSMRAGETKDVTFTYQVTDTNGAITEATGTIHIAGRSDAAIAPTLVFETSANTGSVSNHVQAIAVDHDDKLSYSGHLLSQDGKGNFTYNFDPESYRYLAEGESTQVGGYSYIVTNLSNGTTSIGQWFVKILGVNDAPTAQDIEATVVENQKIMLDVLQGAFDVDGDTLSISNLSNPQHGTVSIVDGKLEYIPLADYTGLDGFDYTISDDAGGSVTKHVSLTIKENQAPIALNAGILPTNQNTPITVLFNAYDPDDPIYTPLTFQLFGDPRYFIDNGDNTFTFNPGNDFKYLDINASFSLKFTYQATDPQGAVSNLAQGTIIVRGLNDAPITQDISFSTEENTLFTGAFNASDPDFDSLTYSISSSNNSLFTINSNGTFTFDPKNAYEYLHDGETATVAFTYTAKDAYNAASNVSQGTIIVQGHNDAPVADDLGFIQTDQNNPKTFGFNARDLDDISLTYQLFGDSRYFIANDNGTYTFNPGDDFKYLTINRGGQQSANISFTYQATDPYGAVSNIAHGTVKVFGLNDAPIAKNISFTTDETTSLTAAFNVYDPDQGETLTYQLFADDDTLFTLNSGNTFTFNPGTNYQYLGVGESATVSFTYKAVDSHNVVSNVGQGTIIVQGQNQAPVAQSTSYQDVENAQASLGANDGGYVLGGGDGDSGISFVGVDDVTATSTGGLSATVTVDALVNDTTNDLLTINATSTDLLTTGVTTITDSVATDAVAGATDSLTINLDSETSYALDYAHYTQTMLIADSV